jgi:DNA-directed RNA polymerase specialized sigma24 family protein
MKGREVLQQYRKLTREINYLLSRREELQGKMAVVSAFNARESQRNDDISIKAQQAQLDEYAQLGLEIDRRLAKNAQMKKAILRALYDVADIDQFTVLEMVYIRGMTAEETADALHIDRSTVYRWLKKGIQKFSEVYKE